MLVLNIFIYYVYILFVRIVIGMDDIDFFEGRAKREKKKKKLNHHLGVKFSLIFSFAGC